ncbi:MAG: 16S rRNA (cytidine(1402)-2'-O)-methyltransferase [Gemmatimonadales bacterium]
MVTSGRLSIVSTPIGHLGDFSFRGVETLKEAAVIACEDTRHTRRLLNHYGIEAKLVSVHAHTSDAAIERLLDRVEAGEHVAYVTDAGTPGISDPGGVLVERAHARGLTIVPVPGPAAVLAALVASGLPADKFMFLGFLPRKGGARAELLRRIAAERFTCVCYEAPGRTAALLRDLARECGAEREGVVARELTKLHEEVRRGTLADLTAYYEEHPPRGEVTVVIAGTRTAAKVAPDADAATPTTIPERPSDAAKELSRRLGISRQDAYRLLNR